MIKHIPNFITSLNLCIGCYGIYNLWVYRQVEYVFWFVLLAGIFDYLDGWVARLLQVKSEYGKQLDSMADLVSFGLLPSFFLMLQMERIYAPLSIIIALFSAFRLARFNLQSNPSSDFRGLPTPANAIMITSLPFIGFTLTNFHLLGICLISAWLLISNIHCISLKFHSFSWKKNQKKWMYLIGCMLLFATFKVLFLAFVIPFYIILSIIFQLFEHKFRI